jgi:VWFA-related protein
MNKMLLGGALSLAVPLGATLAMQSPQAEIRLVQPTAADYLLGPSELLADIVPANAAVTDVAFFVDGQQVCTVRERPYRCSWDAGNRTVARTVRVVATLADGSRLVKAVRTKSIDLSQSVSVEAVLVSVHVIDDHGHFVDGLSQSQFHVAEDGVPQDITSFLAEDAPASVLLELDTSESMKPAIGDLKTATTSFLQALRPSDRVILSEFSNSLFVLAPATVDRAARLAAVDDLHPAGSTALYDSMIRGVELLKPLASPRALVVFTDGDDNNSLATIDDVRSALQSNDGVLYLIAQGVAQHDEKLRTALARLATDTGGNAYFSTHISSLQGHFADIVNDLSHQYVLGYTPKRDLGDGGWRKISVSLDAPTLKLTVRSRAGYLAVHRGG